MHEAGTSLRKRRGMGLGARLLNLLREGMGRGAMVAISSPSIDSMSTPAIVGGKEGSSSTAPLSACLLWGTPTRGSAAHQLRLNLQVGGFLLDRHLPLHVRGRLHNMEGGGSRSLSHSTTILGVNPLMEMDPRGSGEVRLDPTSICTSITIVT